MIKQNIIVDIMHLPHINFLKNALFRLKAKNYNIDIICLDRNKTLQVAKKEFIGFNITNIGIHRGNLLSIYWDANLIRLFKVFKHIFFNRYDLGLSVGSFILGASLKTIGIPNIQFYDDPENKKNMILQKITATELYYPPIIQANKKIRVFNALKEWAYLSPKYFHPDINKIKKYNLTANKYIFIREVNPLTSNYQGQTPNIISKIARRFPQNYKVIFSLENKKNRKIYPKDWILLEEPVDDIHSLMYYSKIVISSGDSMAREGAMLGVPSIYCGVRDMRANKIMIDKGMLFKINPSEVPDFVTKIIFGEMRFEDQAIFRKNLLGEWVDVTEFIIKQIKKYEGRKE